MLRLDDEWVWDAWVADDGERYHLFFLKAERALGDPALRHTRATVGHAVSEDLVHWENLGQALGPRESGFDDLAVWTGSVVHDGEQWRMFYTAISSSGHHVFDQRIGSVVSHDLHHWRRHSDTPVLPVDRRWYKTLDLAPPDTTGPDLEGSSETWRDPLVLRDPSGDGWHMLLTARAVGAARNDDGVVAHARSRDLTTWEVGPPLCSPGISGARPFTAEPDLFAAPLVQGCDGGWVILGFRNLEPRGLDGFDICDPIPVGLDAEGYLVAR
jgi:beta-fructofuranosidase